eukprot:7192321-Pyramimonas_sp.AAC.3
MTAHDARSAPTLRTRSQSPPHARTQHTGYERDKSFVFCYRSPLLLPKSMRIQSAALHPGWCAWSIYYLPSCDWFSGGVYTASPPAIGSLLALVGTRTARRTRTNKTVSQLPCTRVGCTVQIGGPPLEELRRGRPVQALQAQKATRQRARGRLKSGGRTGQSDAGSVGILHEYSHGGPIGCRKR